MQDTYSLYEAKAKLSAIIRQVREGHSVTVTLHGEPVAEIRPIEPQATTPLERWLAELRARGVLSGPADRSAKLEWKPLAHVPGALARFLADRDDD